MWLYIADMMLTSCHIHWLPYTEGWGLPLHMAYIPKWYKFQDDYSGALTKSQRLIDLKEWPQKIPAKLK